MKNNWSKRTPMPWNIPHPNSPAGRSFDWSSLGAPHPNSPAGRNFDYLSSIGMPHPDTPVGRSFDSSSLGAGNTPGARNELDYIKAEIGRSIRGNKATGSAEALTSLFMRAVALMDFSTEPNEGILYSGQQGEYFTFHMSTLAKAYSKQYNKKPLPWTTDGRWLDDWEPLAAIVGAKNAGQIWIAASIRYTNLLKGDVVIFLANSKYESVFRGGGNGEQRGEQRALYNNSRVTRILYVIEHPAPGFDQPKKAHDGRAWFFPSVKHLEAFMRSNP